MPIQYETEALDGDRVRSEYPIWIEMAAGVLVPPTERVFKEPAGASAETAHSTRSYSYAKEERDRTPECFLAFYGLEEPASNDSAGRLFLAVVAGGMIAAGVFLWRLGRRV
jgi:hypothetical protein